jgi:hypothetical protein
MKVLDAQRFWGDPYALKAPAMALGLSCFVPGDVSSLGGGKMNWREIAGFLVSAVLAAAVVYGFYHWALPAINRLIPGS